jgi:enoyl-CoA hydratase/carnithine racemase
MTKLLLREDRNGVAWLTMNRPAARNALSIGLMEAMDSALADIATDRTVRVVVIAGAGPGFCAGHDLREIRGEPQRAAYEALFSLCARLMQRIVSLPKPVIAQVHGVATAAGCQLVASADLAIAAETARFATPGVHIGLFCTTPMVALSRAVGRKAAMEMLLTGDLIPASRALEIGLVNRVVANDALKAAVTDLATRIARGSPTAIAAGKRAFQRQVDMDLGAAYDFASAVMTENMLADDASEGIDAFLLKREPVWS